MTPVSHPGFHTFKLTTAGKHLSNRVVFAFDQLLHEVKAAGVEARYLALVQTHLEIACAFAKQGVATQPEHQSVEE